MFGTIGHAHIKAGHEADLKKSLDNWETDIRPKIDGHVFELAGHSAKDPREMVFVVLMNDEATYRKLAALPEQDAWFRTMRSHLDGDVRWDDVELDITINN